MVAFQRLGTIGLVVACAVIINFGYVATSLYDVPGVITVVFIPCTLVVCLGWFLKDMRMTIATTFASILVAAFLTYVSLTTPVLFGIIEDVYYRNLFNYTVFLKVMQLIFFTT
ncbi:hypothetical protein E2P65_00145, partial [Candidatus Bathyarchaeota archaeon]